MNEPAEGPSLNRRLATMYAALFLPFAVATPYLQVLLRAQGFDREAIGILQGTVEVVAVLAPPLWGILSDHLHRPRLILLCAVCGSVLSFSFFGWAASLGEAVLVALCFGFFFRPQIPLSDGMTFRLLHGGGGDYGQIRTAGSVSFVSMVLALEWAGVGGAGASGILLCAFAMAGALQLMSLAALPPVARIPAMERPGMEWRLFLKRSFILFVLAAFLGRMAMMSYYHFFTLYVKESIGLDSAGYIWVIGPISEIPVIFFSSYLLGRIGVRRLFGLGLVAIVVRLVGYSYACKLWHLVPLQVLHALTFGAYHVATVTWISRAVPVHMKSSAQTLFAGLTMGLGGLLGGVLGGLLAQHHGYATLYFCFAGLAALGVLVLLFVPETVPRR